MNNKQAEKIRKLVRVLMGGDTRVQYEEQERVIVINGWVNEDGKMVEKKIPIPAKGQRTHVKNTFKNVYKQFKHMFKTGEQRE